MRSPHRARRSRAGSMPRAAKAQTGRRPMLGIIDQPRSAGHRRDAPKMTARRERQWRSHAVTLTEQSHRAPCWRIAEQNRAQHELDGVRGVAARAWWRWVSRGAAASFSSTGYDHRHRSRQRPASSSQQRTRRAATGDGGRCSPQIVPLSLRPCSPACGAWCLFFFFFLFAKTKIPARREGVASRDDHRTRGARAWACISYFNAGE